jgi:carboxyl-terminal processing protease
MTLQRNSMYRWLCVSLTLLVGFSLAANVQGQDRLPADDVVEAPSEDKVTHSIDDLLTKGQEFEDQARWGEALNHYELAVKEFPGNKRLEDRMVVARVHFDVQRRYDDESFREVVLKLTEREAADLYGEVLQKIQTHYYGPPNWSELFRRGLMSFDVALTKPAFRQANLKSVDTRAIDQFRRELQQSMSNVNPRDQKQAREHALWAARAANQKLGLRSSAALSEFLAGATCGLDEYSAFLTPSQLDEVFSQIEGNFVGLGVELKTDSNQLLIVSVIPGGPAGEGGIRPGEKILSVDGKHIGKTGDGDVTSEQAADLLRGEEGSIVEVDIAGRDGEVRSLSLKRQRVDVPCVEGARIIDPEGGVAYLKLTSFQKSTSRDVDEALWRMYREGMRSLVIDLRGNPGGLLTAAVEVADKFVNDGTIVKTRGRSTQEDYDYKAHRPGTWRVPLTVLIDGDSASASEIFAGAIRDHARGKIVGQRSYGKGSVQGIFQLAGASAGVRLTTAKFYSPNGHEISRRGVSPDPGLAVRVTAKPVAESPRFSTETEIDPTDVALQTALTTARQIAVPATSQQASRRSTSK